MNILAIETSCDETAIAYVRAEGGADAPKFVVLAHVISSQVDIHRPFGGVVPSLAKREHIKNLPLVFEEVVAILKAKSCKLDPDRVAVTVGPGLEPALWTGINFAKELSARLGVPLVGANHLEGHLFSNWMDGAAIPFPAIALLVSGGHTALVHMKDMKTWERLGETQDDAAGEAFDKVAKMLGLPYPGGPEVEKVARQGSGDAIAFPRPMLHSGDFNFSFSGLKTAVLYHVRKASLASEASKASVGDRVSYQASEANAAPEAIAANEALIPDICASFQKAAIDVLAAKAMRAADEYGARSLLLCGGVAANGAFRGELARRASEAGIAFHAPDMRYNGDNAAMIAAAAYLGRTCPTDVALPNLTI